MIVGGTFDHFGGKPSMVVKKLAKCLNLPSINGGTIRQLGGHKHIKGDLCLWMPNVSNNEDKIYPIKEQGSILICSKVLRPDRDIGDAVARIFKMHGNAVIAIQKDENKKFKFKLVDALGNIWVDTDKIHTLSLAIKDFQKWMCGVRRAKSSQIHKSGEAVTNKLYNVHITADRMKTLCRINKELADKVELAAGKRYFGNVSTRCALLFPSIKMKEHYIYVSKRNVNKERLTPKDFILAKQGLTPESVMYMSKKMGDKPSVDTPIQLELYKHLPDVICMIHGHAYIKNVPVTTHYRPCGDLREVDCVLPLLENKTMCVNLINHGFLAIGTDLTEFENMLNTVKILPRVPGQERKKPCLF